MSRTAQTSVSKFLNLLMLRMCVCDWVAGGKGGGGLCVCVCVCE